MRVSDEVLARAENNIKQAEVSYFSWISNLLKSKGPTVRQGLV